jgi:hypothetical protein
MSRFWWGRSGDVKSVAWMSWARLGASKMKGGMGFRDLEIFNRALLAKQGWRLLKFYESLVARVMKAKYFRNEDFMSAQLGRRHSYAWRSIFNARGIVDDGSMWRVGNGKKVGIWKDRWLPPPLSTLTFSPHQRLDADARVCSLLDLSTGRWNTQIIQDNFTIADAAGIYSVIPSPQLAPDTMIWRGTPHWMFTVRSDYFQEQQKWTQILGESSHAREVEGFWKALWGGSASCGQIFFVENGK